MAFGGHTPPLLEVVRDDGALGIRDREAEVVVMMGALGIGN